MPTSKQLLAAFIKTYSDASLDLLKRIAEREARGSVTAFERALLADIQETVSALDKEAGRWLREAIPIFYLEGMQQNLDHLRELGEDVAKQATITQVHRAAIKVLVENAYGDLTDASGMVGRRVRDNLRRIGLDAVTTKTSTGQTVRETGKAIVEKLAAEGFKTVQGMRLEAYAELVAITTSREASTRGAINQGTELGYDLVQFSSHASPCPICSVYEGRVYSVSGNDSRYPALYRTAFKGGYATLHPRCKHVLNVYVETLADDPEKDREVSNRAFVDNRTTRQRDAYRAGQTKRRQARERKLKKLERQVAG